MSKLSNPRQIAFAYSVGLKFTSDAGPEDVRLRTTEESALLLRRLRLVQIAGAKAGRAGQAEMTESVEAEIDALETDLEADVVSLYTDARDAFFRDGTINPSDRNTGGAYAREGCYDFQFGAYGTTHVSVWSRSLEDALEEAAGWLADNAPGHIMAEGDEHLESLRRAACEEVGLVYPAPDGADYEADGYYAAFETAEADLMYTESGYLTSYEWHVDGPFETGPNSRK